MLHIWVQESLRVRLQSAHLAAKVVKKRVSTKLFLIFLGKVYLDNAIFLDKTLPFLSRLVMGWIKCLSP